MMEMAALLVSLDRLGLVGVSFNERSLSFVQSLLSLCTRAKLCSSYPALLTRNYCRNLEPAKGRHRRIYFVHSYRPFHGLCDHTLALVEGSDIGRYCRLPRRHLVSNIRYVNQPHYRSTEWLLIYA